MATAMVHLTRGGGLAGVHDHVIVDDDGSFVALTTRPMSAWQHQLDAATLAALKATLGATDLGALAGRPLVGSAVRDGYTYEISNGVMTVTARDGQVFEELRPLLDSLVRLLKRPH